MEAAGAAKIVCQLFANEESKCYISHLVTNDDSSVRKILTHSYQDLIEVLISTIDNWPQYSNGQKKHETVPSPSWPTKATKPVVMSVSPSKRALKSKKVVDAQKWMPRE
jgi:hypothetical protein